MNKRLLIPLLAAGIASGAAATDKDKVLAGDPLTSSRIIAYHAAEIANINAEINFSTVLVFDKSEKILTGLCGDADRWQFEHAANVAVLKPEKSARGAQTNIHVIMESGNIYSLVAHEISNEPGAQADLKLFINPGEDTLLSNAKSQMFVSAAALEAEKRRADEAQAQLDKQKTDLKTKIANAQNTAPEKIRHDYKIDAKKKVQKVFNVHSIYTLNGFTYIEADPQETPAVYEVKDKKPSLIEVQFHNGLYVAPKVIEKGYLKIGKETMNFERIEPRSIASAQEGKS